jgi:pyridoxamine 5'-phosphate oxidase family protein
VTPVSFEFDGTYFYVGGWAPERTRRLRNVKAGNAKVALVVDDQVSVDPRFLRVYGTAELVERQRHSAWLAICGSPRRSPGART